MYVQIVIFKLKADASRELFLKYTEEIISWLSMKPGFVDYELYEGEEFWSDRIVWLEQRFAQEGLKDFLTTTMAAKLINLVEQGYSSFFGQLVRSNSSG